MTSLTITKARKILGKTAEGISDEELQKHIQVAQLLKTIYFKNQTTKNINYNDKYGKS